MVDNLEDEFNLGRARGSETATEFWMQMHSKEEDFISHWMERYDQKTIVEKYMKINKEWTETVLQNYDFIEG